MNLTGELMEKPNFELRCTVILRVFGVLLATVAIHSSAVAQSGGGAAALNIDVTHIVSAVSPMLYGLMTEEINHSYDGGLYAELIQNRIFKDDEKNPIHWSVIQQQENTA